MGPAKSTGEPAALQAALILESPLESSIHFLNVIRSCRVKHQNPAHEVHQKPSCPPGTEQRTEFETC
jgi:hypothetical protein